MAKPPDLAPRLASAWLLVLVICGCREASPGGEGERIFDHARLSVEQVELSGQVLVNHPVLGQPFDIEITDTVLWVSDRAMDPALHMFDIRTGQLLASLGRIGDGPGEFRDVPRLQADAFGREGVWAWDGGHHRLMFFDPNRPVDSSQHTIAFPDHPFAYGMAWLTRDRLMALNYRSLTETLLKFDSLGQLLGAFARETTAPSGTAESQVLEAWADGVTLCPRPSGDRIALSTPSFGRVDLYDTSGRLIRQAEAPFASGPPFVRNEETGQWRYQLNDIYYVSCMASRDGFMLVFSGNGPFVAGGNWIHVFDWEGNLQRVFHLDRRVGALALSEDSSRLYATVPDDATIVVYGLSHER